MARTSKQPVDNSMNNRRSEQLKVITDVIKQIDSNLQQLRQQKTTVQLFESVSQGLYDEIDKLTKKTPTMSVTDLALAEVNELIKEVKELIAEDRYVQRLNIFVPAGNPPQLSDVLLVLRQLRQGLDRFSQNINSSTIRTKEFRYEAQMIWTALDLYINGKRGHNLFSELEGQIENGSTIPTKWRSGASYTLREFNFSFLDSIDLDKYFEQHE